MTWLWGRMQRQVRDGAGECLHPTHRKCAMDGAPGLWGLGEGEQMGVYAATDAESSKTAAVLLELLFAESHEG